MKDHFLDELVKRLRSLPACQLIRNSDGEATYRTNDIGGDYIRRATELTRDKLSEIARSPTSGFNMTIGAGTSGHGVHIKGIAGLLITIAPETAVVAHEERSALGQSCTMADIAIALTGIDDARGHTLVLGPNWAGDLAAWLTPEEAAEAVTKVLGGQGPEDIWSHVNRSAIRLLEESYDPIPKARSAAMELITRAEGEQASTEASRLDRQYPRSYVAETAQIHPNARIDDGTVIAPACKVGPESRIGPDVCLERGVSIGGGATIGEQVTIGYSAHVGEGARIGTGAQISACASVTGRIQIGSRCVIGEGSQLAGADMPEQTTVASRLKITTPAEMARYAIQLTAPATAPRAQQAPAGSV